MNLYLTKENDSQLEAVIGENPVSHRTPLSYRFEGRFGWEFLRRLLMNPNNTPNYVREAMQDREDQINGTERDILSGFQIEQVFCG